MAPYAVPYMSLEGCEEVLSGCLMCSATVSFILSLLIFQALPFSILVFQALRYVKNAGKDSGAGFKQVRHFPCYSLGCELGPRCCCVAFYHVAHVPFAGCDRNQAHGKQLACLMGGQGRAANQPAHPDCKW